VSIRLVRPTGCLACRSPCSRVILPVTAKSTPSGQETPSSPAFRLLCPAVLARLRPARQRRVQKSLGFPCVRLRPRPVRRALLSRSAPSPGKRPLHVGCQCEAPLLDPLLTTRDNPPDVAPLASPQAHVCSRGPTRGRSQQWRSHRPSRRHRRRRNRLLLLPLQRPGAEPVAAGCAVATNAGAAARPHSERPLPPPWPTAASSAATRAAAAAAGRAPTAGTAAAVADAAPDVASVAATTDSLRNTYSLHPEYIPVRNPYGPYGAPYGLPAVALAPYGVR
jgi:hypothetical protein